MSDTIAAVSTGTQVCAIGIVRMSGGKAIEIADRLFSPVSGRKMADCEDRKLIYGKLCDEQGRLLDICLCTISRAPNSYTGEDTAEFQCHGSPSFCARCSRRRSASARGRLCRRVHKARIS